MTAWSILVWEGKVIGGLVVIAGLLWWIRQIDRL